VSQHERKHFEELRLELLITYTQPGTYAHYGFYIKY